MAGSTFGTYECYWYDLYQEGKIYEFKLTDRYPVGPAPSDPGRIGTLLLDEQSCDCCDYSPTYEDVLIINEDEPDSRADLIDIRSAREAGDLELVRMLETQLSLELSIAKHCKAVLAGMRAAEYNQPVSEAVCAHGRRGCCSVEEIAAQRPGVMIKAEPYSWVAGNNDPYEDICKAVAMLQPPKRIVASNLLSELEQRKADESLQKELTIVAGRERTCPTCSKTCDVGVACWWCGGAA